MSLNVHHLELFYYVAHYEGITQAVRKMPYGIQQPAVSGQIKQLEQSLGDIKLFHRRPFALTPAGEELYDHVAPFFSKLDRVEASLLGEESQHLRLAASAAVMTSHLPDVLRNLRSHFPDLRLTLRETKSADIEVLLQRQEVDLAIASLPSHTAPGIQTIKLLELPLLLLSRKDHRPITRLDQLSQWTGSDGATLHRGLISLPALDPVAQRFQAGISKRGFRWEGAVEVSELPLISEYVQNGFGCGVTLDIPGCVLPDTLQVLRLPKADFPPVVVGILHTRPLKPIASRFIEEAQAFLATLER